MSLGTSEAFEYNNITGSFQNLNGGSARPLILIGTGYNYNLMHDYITGDPGGGHNISYFISASTPESIGHNSFFNGIGQGSNFTVGINYNNNSSDIVWTQYGTLSTWHGNFPTQ